MHTEIRPPAQRWDTIDKVFVIQRAAELGASGTDIRVLTAMIELARARNACWAASDTIAFVCGGLPIRTVRRSIKRLAALGVLKLERQGGGGTLTSSWLIPVPDAPPFKERTDILEAERKAAGVVRFDPSKPSLQNNTEMTKRTVARTKRTAGEDENAHQYLSKDTEDIIPSAPTAHSVNAGAGLKQRISILDRRIQDREISTEDAFTALERLYDEASEQDELGHIARLLDGINGKITAVLDGFNEKAGRRSDCRMACVLTDKRRKLIARRLDECGVEGILAMIDGRFTSNRLARPRRDKKLTLEAVLSDFEWNTLLNEHQHHGVLEGATA